MLLCGLKLTHDGAVALMEDGKLISSVEMEKLGNNARFTEIEDTAVIEEVLASMGCRVEDVDHFAIDGWGGYDQDQLAIQPRLTIGDKNNRLSALNRGRPYALDIDQYRERTLKDSIVRGLQASGLAIGDHTRDYTSYKHVAGHILGAYCTSPFADAGESSYVFVWDGGMYPRLYYVDAATRQVENLGPICLLVGNIYTIFSQHFEPFKVNDSFAKDSLSIAGKVMAYVAKGRERPELSPIFDEVYNRDYDTPMGFANLFARNVKQEIEGQDIPDRDVLRSFHEYLKNLLIDKLKKKMSRFPRPSRHLAMAGGCALNIKWNSAIRDSGLFDAVYVPPFPNDSGSAIGAGACAMFERTTGLHLQFSVYGGPKFIHNEPAPGWTARSCSIAELAALLHRKNEPVVFLNGRAELGPRALGNRSILASCHDPLMKDVLNRIKQRESYRPVSPICLEDRAPAWFEPGTPDPFMLFDHRVRDECLDRIPAVTHLDNTARLQTINAKEHPLVAELLVEYESLSGIPMLCNTSANHLGKGFFPDLLSATAWGGTNYVWSGATLFEKEVKDPFETNPETTDP